MRYLRVVFILVIFGLVLLPQGLQAGKEKYSVYRNGELINQDSTLVINDPVPYGGTKINNYINAVLRFDDSRRLYYPNVFTVKVKYDIVLTKVGGSQLPVIHQRECLVVSTLQLKPLYGLHYSSVVKIHQATYMNAQSSVL